MKKHIDPYSGESFIPKRSNQRFAYKAHQIAFNNAKAKMERDLHAYYDSQIKKNWNILKAILKNNFDKKKEVNLFKEEVRRVSTLECLRLQGFPDNTEKYFIENKISQTSSYKIIGNSVPVPLASAVISNFLKYFM